MSYDRYAIYSIIILSDGVFFSNLYDACYSSVIDDYRKRGMLLSSIDENSTDFHEDVLIQMSYTFNELLLIIHDHHKSMKVINHDSSWEIRKSRMNFLSEYKSMHLWTHNLKTVLENAGIITLLSPGKLSCIQTSINPQFATIIRNVF